MKDEKIVYYKIKIIRIRERKRMGKASMSYKDKMYCIECFDYSGHGVGFCEPTLKKAFKTLMKELYL